MACALEPTKQNEQLYSNQPLTEDIQLGEDIPFTEDIPDPNDRYENRFAFNSISDLPPPIPTKGGVTH